MDQLLDLYFNLETMQRFFPMLREGFVLTLQMTLLVVSIGISTGLLLALVRAFGVRLINWPMQFLVDFLRAVPPLVVIMCTYFALPYAGMRLSPFVATVASLALILAAFAEEIFWSGITSVNRGQWEAGRATGLNFLQTLVHIILPQGVRLAVPLLTNRTIEIGKATSLGSAISVADILNQATSAQSIVANPSPLTLAALMYVVLFVPLVMTSRWVERRYRWQH
ncbi:amino acid ABC transporter membrane protein 1, PAAT family [Kushneria avicenniae]|uniref:Amino acid ABC transporter membrane protein 1, PAAT family n=1 Tax=Kushneria avicenniae TaxID=402385 RepID=A0A1I1IC57_9GAMM|nr:amino acid ABC transporter permease [Kushneria avicenniae]SFC33836.1 amino acid ABC transporter membrane protein 1, PAAT family [Kushneria avicenniae]